MSLVFVSAGIFVAVGGCTGSGFGSELASPPVGKPLSGLAGKTLRLPRDEKFSIRLETGSQKAELGGEAAFESKAVSDGTASASSQVDAGGLAEGLFQLGHAVQNDTERQMDLNVRMRCKYEMEVSNNPPTALPDAFAGLNLYVRDGHNRLIRSDVLAAQSTELGGTAGSAQVERSFLVTIGPGETAAIFIAGQARAEVKPQRSARSSLRISGLEMEIEPRVAPPVRTTGGG